MSSNHLESNPYDQLEMIREAAQALARRDSVESEPLLNSAETFWLVIHGGDGDSSEWSGGLRERLADLAEELADVTDLSTYVHGMDHSAADRLSGRIQDLRNRFGATWTREAC